MSIIFHSPVIKVLKSIISWLYICMKCFLNALVILIPLKRLVNYSILLLLYVEEKIFHNLSMCILEADLNQTAMTQHLY